MNNPKISVIVPVYNVEQYLEECLESLVNQTMIEEMEVLMIDDGSTDNSRYIIEKYALDYENFHAYHKENEGLAITRNVGMSHAKGEYIRFIDSDDCIPLDSNEKLYNLISKYNHDIVTGRFNKESKYNAWENILSKNSFKNVKENINSTHIKELTDLVWDATSCNKLYKKEFLEKYNIKFPNEKIYYEDIIFTFKCYYFANSIGIINENVYNWRVRTSDNSITQNKNSIKNPKDRFKILNLVHNFIKDNKVNNDIVTAVYRRWLNHDLNIHMKQINNYPKEYYSELIEESNKLLNLIPDNIKNEQKSYLKILYKMIENKDIESLLKFAHLENDLKKNPECAKFLNEEYKQLINFKKDGEKEELICKSEKIEYTNENILINIELYIPYIAKEEEDISIILESKNKNYPLKYEKIGNKERIILPIELIKEEEYLKIKIKYKTSELEKEAYLRNKKRQTIKYKDLDVDFCTGINRLLLIKPRLKNDNKIQIEYLKFNKDELELKGTSSHKINNLIIENIVTFEKIKYNIKYLEKSNEFTFNIPYKDINNTSIKSWELKSDAHYDSIKISKKYELLKDNNRIIVKNGRNKILIDNETYNKTQYFNELNKENQKLKKKQKEMMNSTSWKLTKPLRKIRTKL